MMRYTYYAVLALALAVASTLAARAADDPQLDRIPTPAPSASTSPAPVRPKGRIFLEDAASTQALRAQLAVPFPSPGPADWENRTSLDAYRQFSRRHFSFTLSNRLNITEESAFGFPSKQTLRSDLREAFAGLSLGDWGEVEAGRINIRNGVALGYNPTDFFKTRSLVDQASLDPTVLRDDRLGTVAAHLQVLGSRDSADVYYSPKLTNPSAIGFIPSSGINPRLDETNSTNRFEVALSAKLADLEPQVLVYHDATQTRFGLNLSHQANKSLVVYGEWAGGTQADLIARALAFGTLTNTLPANVQSVLPNDASARFQNDVSVGASWTSPRKTTVNLEYEYHQSGLSRQDWQNWINLGSATSNPAVTNQLWYIRSYANDQQEPLVHDQLFVRVDQTDAFVPDLELTGFAFVNLYDGSLLTQLSANYDLSARWSFALYLNAEVGGAASERGTFPADRGLTLQVRRYL